MAKSDAIDHILVNGRMRDLSCVAKVEYSLSLSDHFPFTGSFSYPLLLPLLDVGLKHLPSLPDRLSTCNGMRLLLR